MAETPDEIRTFAGLANDQRATAWAVVRSLATALWGALALMVVVAVFVVSRDPGLALPAAVPLAGVVGLAVGLEVKSRDLEKDA